MGRRTDPSQPPLVRFSAALTGREQLLPVIGAIDPAKPINATAVAAKLDGDVAAAYRELDLLRAIGLLRETASDRATTDFEITDREAWDSLEALCRRGRLGKVVPV
jgi:Fe2+ or Zn2+ uptake regulation protein